MKSSYQWERAKPTPFQIGFGIGAGIVASLLKVALVGALAALLAWYGFAAFGFLLDSI